MPPSEFLGRHYSDVLPPDLAGKMDAAYRIARGGEVSDFEYSLELGETKSHFMARVSPLVEDGEFAGVISVSRDITSLVEAERQRRRIRAELERAHKLESMGVMAGGVAHDFNNLLEGIIGQTDLALADGGCADSVEERLRRIRSTAERASELSDKMLAYSGRGGRELMPVDLSELLRSMDYLLRSSAGADVQVEISAPGGPAFVLGDPSQLEQVVMNLVLNGAEAVAEERTPRLEVRLDSVRMDREELSSTYVDDDLSPGRYARLTVSDNGCGMDETTLHRVFDPFFTTKFTGRGLGLASVLGIARGHGGAVSVSSSPGEGSCFTVLLPLAEGGGEAPERHPESPPEAEPLPEDRITGEREAVVLVIDDEPIILETASELLSHLGYSVRTASSGRAALEVLDGEPSGIDCAVLDVTMPGMDGFETLQAIRRVAPDLPVVVSSGYSREEIMPRFLEAGVEGFLHKPYSLAEIREALQRAVEGGER
jgi:signal transduction histidine kinase/CheY-like chemotaxis protein